MKICITAQGDSLESGVESRFGRSPYFIIYDSETSEFEAVKNPNVGEASGVGIKSGQLIADKKVQVVLTGKVGPKATDALKAANIEIKSNASGIVKEVIEKYKTGAEFKADREQYAEQLQDVKRDDWFGRCLRRWFGFGHGGSGGRGEQERGMGHGGRGRRGFAGSSGYCVCPKCGKRIKHQQGLPCRANSCQECGTVMVRE